MEVNPIQLKNIVHGYYDIPGSVFFGKDVTNMSLSVTRGSGGIITNTDILTRWIRLLFAGKVMPISEFKKMTTVACTGVYGWGVITCTTGAILLPEDKNIGYSAGLFRAYDFYQSNEGYAWLSNGGIIGYKTNITYFVKQNIIISIAGDSMQEESGIYEKLTKNIFDYLSEYL